MKKLFIAIVAVFAMSTVASAQLENIGVRLGAGNAFGAEISGQWGMGSNRLETDLGIDAGKDWTYLGLSAVYQWKGDIAGEFGWFAGPGANLGLFIGDKVNDAFGLSICLQGGIEWNPSAIPFQFSLDVRPAWRFIGEDDGFGFGLALGVRYRL